MVVTAYGRGVIYGSAITMPYIHRTTLLQLEDSAFHELFEEHLLFITSLRMLEMPAAQLKYSPRLSSSQASTMELT